MRPIPPTSAPSTPARARSAPAIAARIGLALSGLLIALLWLGRAEAQPFGVGAEADPPARVGKIGLIAGPVTLTDVRNTDPQPAVLNWPITSGHRLLTGPGGRAEVRIGSLALRIDGDAAVDFPRVDDDAVQIAVLRGTASLRVRNRDLLREYQLLTPRERITFDDIGRYRIDVDRAAPGLTTLTAFAGTARITTARNSFVVPAGFRGEIGAEPYVSFQLVAATRDGFDDWVAAMDARDDTESSSRYVSRETTGVELLDHYGGWRTVPEYGAIWFPASVPSGWAPYRYGRWAYVSPWGWTWVDDAPWGFATCHYGRWVVVGGVWGWVPGTIVPRPVYAPALVGWYGRPGGVSVGVSVGPLVGWFPLGPREVYVPPFRYSNRYWHGVNRPYVPNIEQVPLPGPGARYMHQRAEAATWSRAEAVVAARPIQREVVRAPEDLYRWPATSLPAQDLRPQSPGRILPSPGFSAQSGVSPPHGSMAPSTPAAPSQIGGRPVAPPPAGVSPPSTVPQPGSMQPVAPLPVPQGTVRGVAPPVAPVTPGSPQPLPPGRSFGEGTAVPRATPPTPGTLPPPQEGRISAPRAIEPPPVRMEPPPVRMDSPPPVRMDSPPPVRMEPPPVRLEPQPRPLPQPVPVQPMQPPAARMQPPPVRIEPAPRQEMQPVAPSVPVAPRGVGGPQAVPVQPHAPRQDTVKGVPQARDDRTQRGESVAPTR